MMVRHRKMRSLPTLALHLSPRSYRKHFSARHMGPAIYGLFTLALLGVSAGQSCAPSGNLPTSDVQSEESATTQDQAAPETPADTAADPVAADSAQSASDSVDIAAANRRVNIAGYVRNASGAGISNVTVVASNGADTTVTDANGYYTLRVVRHWVGVVAPQSTAYTFSPTSRSYSDAAANYSGQNYTAAPILTNTTPVADAVSATGYANTPVTITLTGSDPAGLDLTFAIVTGPAHGSLGAIDNTPTASASVVYTPAAGYTGPDTFTFRTHNGSAVSDPASCTITISARPTMNAPYASQPVTLDGVLAAGEWADARVYSMDATDAVPPGVVVAGTTTTTADTSAKIYVKHDANYVYVAVDVTDDIIVPTATNTWDADSVELYLDQDNSRSTNVGVNRMQFTLTAGGTMSAMSLVPANSWTGAAAQRTGGYVVEFRLSKSALGLAASGSYGFDVAISDIEPAAANVSSRYWYASTVAAEMDESRWGTLTLEPGLGSLAVSPAGGLTSSGNPGGPFSPASVTYTLTNSGGAAVSWTASAAQGWITLSKSSGTLAAGASDSVVASVNSTAGTLPAGSYNDSISFSTSTGGTGTSAMTSGGGISRPVSLTVNAAGGVLAVTPTNALNAAGIQGGPFTPASATYTLTNSGGTAINWTAGKTQSWTTVSKSSGTLAAGASDSVVVSVNSTANSLAAGSYADTVTFTNTTNGNGNATRSVALRVDPVALQAVSAPYAAQAVTLDGVISAGEWSDANSYTMDAVDAIPPGVVTDGVTATAADTSAKVYLKHDANYLYVAVDVTDDLVVPSAPNVYDADSVELFLDADNSNTVGITYSQRLQFDIAAGGGLLSTPAVPAGSWTGAAAQRAGGYVVEYRLSKSALGLTTGGTYGIDLNINDIEPTAGNLQTGYWFLSPGPSPVSDESQWGGLTLQAPTQPIPATSKSTVDFGASSTTQTFDVWNSGAGTLSYTISSSAPWLTVTPASGTSTGEHDTITATVNRSLLASGANQGTLTVSGGTAGSLTITVTAQNVPGTLAVSPSAGLLASGYAGGTFSPASTTYTLTNSGGSAINWTVGKTQSWLTVSKASGSLAAGASDAVTVSINTAAASLTSGTYTDTVTFTNTTNGGGNGTRTATLHVVPVMSITASPTSGVAPFAVQFSANPASATLPTGSTLSWDFGDGTSTATGATVTHTYSAAGTFVATLSLLMPGGLPTYALSQTTTTSTAPATTRSPMTTASRTSGVAPLSVYFDAVDFSSPAWTSGVVQPTNGDYTTGFTYTWDFGDAGSGTWRTGRSRNTATGFQTAHVYETPGTYVATLDITDATGKKYSYQQTITVSAFSGTTYYVSSSSGNDNNSGTSSSAPLQSFTKAMSKAAANTQILFKRGDTWTISSTYSCGVDGPVIVADYGTGAKPTFVTASGLGSSDTIDAGRKDWRFINLNVIGCWNGDTTSGGIGINADSSTHTLISRCDFTKTGLMSMSCSFANSSVIYECTSTNVRMMGIYVERTTKTAVIGCYIHDTVNSHNIYSNSMHKAVFANNQLDKVGNGRHNLRVTAEYTGSGKTTKFVVISQNNINSGTWMAIHLGPNESSYTQSQDNILVERNRIAGATERAVSIEAGTNHVTVVDNVVTDYGQILIDHNTRTSDPDPMNVTIANNTLLSNNVEAAVKVNCSGHKNVVIKNNIIQNYTSDTGSVTAICLWVVDPNGLAEVTSDYNLYYMSIAGRVNRVGPDGSYTNYTLSGWQGLGKDAHSKNADPKYVNMSGGDYHLQSTSPAVNAGTAIPWVMLDYDGTARPQGGAMDIGACEYR